MRYKFTSIKDLKQQRPDLNPFYTQSWVYGAITAFFSEQEMFDQLEFNDAESDLFIKDWNGIVESSDGYLGSVFEGHVDYWARPSEIPHDVVLFSGHEHFAQSPGITSLGFDYWDSMIYTEFLSPVLAHEINRSSVSTAIYDATIPVGVSRSHRSKFLEILAENKKDLQIVTDSRQNILDTNLRFDDLGIEVYLNKVGIPRYKSYQSYSSFYDTNKTRSLDHLPHKKMHAISRVNVALETTVYDTKSPYCTEKTYKILAQHRPFVIYGDTFILKNLRDQGFLTFDKYCEESCDSEVSVEKRAELATTAINQLAESCRRYPNEIDLVCAHNQKLFFSQQRHTSNLAKFGRRILDVIK